MPRSSEGCRAWNVAIERALGTTTTVSVSYVGALGRRLLREERLLNPSPQIQTLTIVTNHGHARYNALQTKYTRRLSRGLQVLAAYTPGRFEGQQLERHDSILSFGEGGP